MKALTRVWLAVALWAGLAGAAHAMLIETPVPTIAQESAHVVRGRVVSMQSAWTADETTIVTTVAIQVDGSLKGSLAKGARIQLAVEGGEAGEFGVRVEHQPEFEAQEDVYLFLTVDERGQLKVNYDEQGKFSVVENHVLNQLHDPVPLAAFEQAVLQTLPHDPQEDRR